MLHTVTYCKFLFVKFLFCNCSKHLYDFAVFCFISSDLSFALSLIAL